MQYMGTISIKHTSWTSKIDMTFGSKCWALYDGIEYIPMVDQSIPILHHTITNDNASLILDFGIIVPGRSGNIHIHYAK